MEGSPMKTRLHTLISTLLILAPMFFVQPSSMSGVDSAYAQSAEDSDVSVPNTLTRGIVKGIHLDYENALNKVAHRLTALITIQITEVVERPEDFCYGEKSIGVGDFVDVSYNYSGPPECRVNDIVEVYGLWVTPVDLPDSQTIRVDDYVVEPVGDALIESYVKTIAEGGEGGEGDSSMIDTQSEYSDGSIPLGQDMNLWYVWVNASGTQVVFFTYYSEVYNSPIMTFLGEHYQTVDETEVFMGNTLLLMEAYDDANGNGVPEADFTTGTSEIEYFFIVNSSVGFVPMPVQKTVMDYTPHYTWGVRYERVDGALLYPEDRLMNGVWTNLAARVNITHLTFTYEYHVQEDASYLKTGFEVGEIVDIEPYTSNMNMTLNELGLSLLYGTTTLTAKPYTVLVNNEPYDSIKAEAPAVPTSRAEVMVEDMKTYEFIFEENYTLHRDSIVEVYDSKSAASAIDSVPPNADPYLSPYWLVGWLLRHLSDDVFPGMSTGMPDIDLNYTSSSFVYRVCYPLWEGWRIEHDPTYVAYITAVEVGPPQRSLPIEPSFETLVAVTAACTFALAVALIELRRTKRILKISPSTTYFRGGKWLWLRRITSDS
jgi:hypothetical protein